jgi:hypothetical protein
MLKSLVIFQYLCFMHLELSILMPIWSFQSFTSTWFVDGLCFQEWSSCSWRCAWGTKSQPEWFAAWVPGSLSCTHLQFTIIFQYLIIYSGLYIISSVSLCVCWYCYFCIFSFIFIKKVTLAGWTNLYLNVNRSYWQNYISMPVYGVLFLCMVSNVKTGNMVFYAIYRIHVLLFPDFCLFS